MTESERDFQAAKAHHRAGRLSEAERLYRAVLTADPQHHGALHLLGVLAHQCGDSASAEKLIRGALALKPDEATHYNHLGLVLASLGRKDEAERCFRSAAAFDPQLAEAHNNLANLIAEDDPEEALACLSRARALAPGEAEIVFNLGNVLRTLDRPDHAEEAYRAAIALNPEHAGAHVALGLLLLARGEFEEGGALYEWRWRLKPPPSPRPTFAAPEWDGSPLPGTLLLYAEQGLGDTIQFCRFASLAAARCGSVILQVPPQLTRLLSSLPVEVLAMDAPLPPTDAHCALMSLPWRLELGRDDLAPTMPYLAAESPRVDAWRQRLPGRRPRVGITWRGNPKAKFDCRRSIPLNAFAAFEGVQLIALQKHHGLEEVNELPGLVMPGPGFDEGPDAFLDTAAILQDLDLVITSDTAVAHLAGALAQPVWLALPKVPDWRWQLGERTSPWYPTMRLFRQTVAGNWSKPFAEMANELQKRTTPETS